MRDIKTSLHSRHGDVTRLTVSTPWKIFLGFFHAMEKMRAIFPHYGKKVSIVWKAASD
jgi:hypothetical protein